MPGFRPLLALVLFAIPAFAQPPATPQETSITVTGTGRTERSPDYVDVILGVENDDKTAGAAQAAADKIMSQVHAAVTKLDLPGLDLKTGTVDLGPRYERRNHDEEIPKVIGYRASITIRVRTTDLHAVPRIVDAALSAGANRVDGVQFGIKEALEAREEAMRLAGKAVKRKAATLADSLSLKLGRVITANTSAQQYSGWGNRFSNSVAQQVAYSPPPGEDSPGSVVPGTIEVMAEVTVTYAASELK